MNGTILRFYVHENRTHKHIALFEWLLEQAVNAKSPRSSG